MALDFCVLEEHDRAGSLVGECDEKILTLLDDVPGVAATTSREMYEEDFVVDRRPEKIEPRGKRSGNGRQDKSSSRVAAHPWDA